MTSGREEPKRESASKGKKLMRGGAPKPHFGVAERPAGMQKNPVVVSNHERGRA